jgi:hypothetical protein
LYGDSRDVVLVDRGCCGLAVRAAHHVAGFDLRCPGQRVGREVGQTQDSPLQTGAGDEVLGGLELGGEAGFPRWVLDGGGR